jgi:membrane protein
MQNGIQGKWRQLRAMIRRARRYALHGAWRVGKPGEDLPGGLLTKQVRVAFLLVRELVQDALLDRAAALTFVTVLSLIPLLILVLSVVQTFDLEGAIYGDLSQGVEDFITDELFQGVAQKQETLAQEVVVEPGLREDVRELLPGESEESAGGDASAGQAPADAAAEDGQVEDIELINPVEWLIQNAKERARPKALNITGIVFVIACLFGLMTNIEKAFNRIWGLRQKRSWFRMLSDYITVIVLLPFVVAAAIAATVVVETRILSESWNWLIRFGRFVLVWLAFSAMYYFIPTTRVRARYALLGGAAASLMWVLASWGFGELQRGMLSRYGLLYSGLAQVPIMFMWIFVSWAVVLFGAELTFAYQHERSFAMERFADKAPHGYIEALALWAMLELCRRFEEGGPALSASDAADEWNVPPRLLNETLTLLEDEGLVRSVSEEKQLYMPARSLAKISIGDVIRAVRESGEDPSDLREAPALKPLLERIRHADDATLGAPLSEFANGPSPPVGRKDSDETA